MEKALAKPEELLKVGDVSRAWLLKVKSNLAPPPIGWKLELARQNKKMVSIVMSAYSSRRAVIPHLYYGAVMWDLFSKVFARPGEYTLVFILSNSRPLLSAIIQSAGELLSFGTGT
jgi:hypothetical protein